MTEREKVLLRREGAVAALTDCMTFGVLWDDEERRRQAELAAARLFPFPTRTVPTVRQGVVVLAGNQACWYRVFEDGSDYYTWRRVERYYTRADAMARSKGKELGGGWPPEDQPTVAALLLLPLTEEVEDTGEEGA